MDLHCPRCEDNLGKEIENPKDVQCGRCGEEFDNPHGYTEQEEIKVPLIELLKQRPKYIPNGLL